MARIIARTKVKPPAAPTVTALSTSELRAVFTAPAGFNIATLTSQFSFDTITWEAAVTSASLAVTRSGLSPGTTGYFRALVTDASGNSSPYSASGSATTTAAGPSAADKFAIYWIGGDFLTQYQSAAGIANMARRQVVIMLAWPELEAARGVSNATIVNAVKAASTVGTKIFGYYNCEALEYTDSVRVTYRNKLNSANWWLYQSGSSGARVNSFFSGAQGTVNITDSAGADGEGLYPTEWITRHWWGVYSLGTEGNAVNPDMDGMFCDNVFVVPRVEGDWNRDGSSDNWTNGSGASVATTRPSRRGYSRLAQWFRANYPTKFIIGNTSDHWLSREIGYSYPVDELNQEYHGGIWEGQLLYDDPFYTASQIGQHLRDVEDTHRAPNYFIYEHWPITQGTASDHRSASYGFAHCRVCSDGYFDYALTSGHAVHEWFDWFDFRLGAALETRRTAATHGTAWLRNFADAVVIWWPLGSTETVSLGGTFYALTGDGARWLTPGSAVTSVTPPTDRNGIILSRTPTSTVSSFGLRVLATKEIDNNTAANPSVTLSGGNIPVNGRDLLVCIAAYYGSDDSPASITDDRGTGNVYTKIDNGDAVTGGAITNKATVYLCKGYQGTNAPTITINQGAKTGEYVTWCVLEVTGLTASPVDTNARGTQRGVGGSSGSVAAATPTTQAANLVVAVASYEYGTAGAGVTTPSGYTSVFTESDGSANESGGVAYRITNAISTPTATWTWTAGPHPWHCVLVTLKVA